MSPFTGPAIVRGLQERAARASPATRVERAEGWWLRHAPGCAWWTGTVLPHGPGRVGDLARQVEVAEAFYAADGALASFQITPGICPPELDSWLSAAGYVKHDSILLQVASTTQVVDRAASASLRVEVDDRPTTAWFDTWYTVHGQGSDAPCEWELLARVEPPSGYASAVMENKVVGVGRVVAESGWAGVFGMATLPEARGRGVARSVLGALAHWADVRHVDHLYLQVERGNIQALRLYGQAGFTKVCGYHYRSLEQARCQLDWALN